MLWILLDVAIAAAALVVLAVLVLGLWRKVKALSSTVSAASERLTEATDRLEAAQLAGPQPGSPRPPST